MARASALSESKSFMNPPLNSSGAPGTCDLSALQEPFDGSYFFFFFFYKVVSAANKIKPECAYMLFVSRIIAYLPFWI